MRSRHFESQLAQLDGHACLTRVGLKLLLQIGTPGLHIRCGMVLLRHYYQRWHGDNSNPHLDLTDSTDICARTGFLARRNCVMDGNEENDSYVLCDKSNPQASLYRSCPPRRSLGPPPPFAKTHCRTHGHDRFQRQNPRSHQDTLMRVVLSNGTGGNSVFLGSLHRFQLMDWEKIREMVNDGVFTFIQRWLDSLRQALLTTQGRAALPPWWDTVLISSSSAAGYVAVRPLSWRFKNADIR